jgi:hypothetical protein
MRHGFRALRWALRDPDSIAARVDVSKCQEQRSGKCGGRSRAAPVENRVLASMREILFTPWSFIFHFNLAISLLRFSTVLSPLRILNIGTDDAPLQIPDGIERVAERERDIGSFLAERAS